MDDAPEKPEIEEEKPDELRFEYTLRDPIEYAHEGARVKAELIRFTAPTSKHRHECAFLKQALSRAFADFLKLGASMQKAAKDAGAKLPEQDAPATIVLDADSVKGMIETSGIKLEDVIEAGRRLFCSTPPPVAMIDGVEKLTGPRYDDLSYRDVEDMTAGYIGHFFGGSVLKSLSGI